MLFVRRQYGLRSRWRREIVVPWTANSVHVRQAAARAGAEMRKWRGGSLTSGIDANDHAWAAARFDSRLRMESPSPNSTSTSISDAFAR